MRVKERGMKQEKENIVHHFGAPPNLLTKGLVTK